MKIKVDKENKTVIAYGSCKGKRIKAIAVCKEPVFNEDFGVKLAKRKYKIREDYAKLRYHENTISCLKDIVRRAKNMIADHEKCANELDVKIQSRTNDCEDFVNEYFNK